MVALLSFAIALSSTAVQRGQQTNPYAPPRAFRHYAPDRTCDLLNVTLDIDVDWPTRTYVGHVVNTMSPLRNGITQVKLNAGPVAQISKMTVDGVVAKYTRDGRVVTITTPRLAKGKAIKIAIDFKAVNSKAQPFGGEGGFH